MSVASIIFERARPALKKAWPCVFLLVLSVLFFHPLLSSRDILNNIHYINDLTFSAHHMRMFLHEHQGVPLWTPYFYAGHPLLAIAENFLFDLNFLYIWLFNDIYLAMNLSLISYFFIAGLGMFSLGLLFTRNTFSALIGAILYMFNGFVIRFIIPGHLNLMEGYALIPLAVLCAHQGLHQEHWLPWAIGCGTLMALMVLSGSIIFLLYALLIVGIYMACCLMTREVLKRLVRALKVGLVLLVVLFSLSAIKLLPTIEFTSLSSRASGVSYEEFLGYPIALGQLWSVLANLGAPVFSAAVGIVGCVLALLGALSLKKRAVFFCIVLVILGLLLALGTFVSALFYHFPGFSQMRHIERALVMVAFGVPLLAACGSSRVAQWLAEQNPFKSWNYKESIIGFLLLGMVVAEVLMLVPWPEPIPIVNPSEIPIIAAVSEDRSDFRVATLSMPTPIGASGYNYYSQLGISEVKGGGGIWTPEYVQFLALAQQYPSLFGVLGAKHLITHDLIENPTLEFKGTFEGCSTCPIWEAYGPHLYENIDALPRAFLSSTSVLLIGSERSRKEAALAMLIEHPGTSVALIDGKQLLGDYTIDELHQHETLLLLEGSVREHDGPLLQQYTARGGAIVPDVLSGEVTLSRDQIMDLLSNQSSIKTIDVKDLSFNSYRVELPGEQGWLVLSERAAHFPGWEAKLNGKEKTIHRAQSAISAVYVEEEGTLIFTYRPSSFIRGAIITTVAIIVLIIVIALEWTLRRKHEAIR